MKIAHLCLSNFYIDGYGYQENELVRQHVKKGHDVTVLASTETFSSEQRLTYVDPAQYMGEDGALVIRLPYRRFLPHSLMKKLRIYPGVLSVLRQQRPEVIFFHGLCGWELRTVARYKKENPSVKLYVDNHADPYNSARTFISKFLLHRFYYRWIVRGTRWAFEKVLCVSYETMKFARENYGVPPEQLEFFPLGGKVFDDSEYKERRQRGRSMVSASDGEVLLVQAGKIDRRKKILESLRAFVQTPGASLRFVIVGSLHEEIRSEAHALIASDPRILFLGWKSPDEINNLLCGADVYVQPGSQSAIMQMALCARCPVMLADVPSHKPYINENGWLLRNDVDLRMVFDAIVSNPTGLEHMAMQSLKISQRLLDYRTLADRVLC